MDRRAYKFYYDTMFKSIYKINNTDPPENGPWTKSNWGNINAQTFPYDPISEDIIKKQLKFIHNETTKIMKTGSYWLEFMKYIDIPGKNQVRFSKHFILLIGLYESPSLYSSFTINSKKIDSEPLSQYTGLKLQDIAELRRKYKYKKKKITISPNIQKKYNKIIKNKDLYIQQLKKESKQYLDIKEKMINELNQGLEYNSRIIENLAERNAELELNYQEFNKEYKDIYITLQKTLEEKNKAEKELEETKDIISSNIKNTQLKNIIIKEIENIKHESMSKEDLELSFEKKYKNKNFDLSIVEEKKEKILKGVNYLEFKKVISENLSKIKTEENEIKKKIENETQVEVEEKKTNFTLLNIEKEIEKKEMEKEQKNINNPNITNLSIQNLKIDLNQEKRLVDLERKKKKQNRIIDNNNENIQLLQENVIEIEDKLEEFIDMFNVNKPTEEISKKKSNKLKKNKKKIDENIKKNKEENLSLYFSSSEKEDFQKNKENLENTKNKLQYFFSETEEKNLSEELENLEDLLNEESEEELEKKKLKKELREEELKEEEIEEELKEYESEEELKEEEIEEEQSNENEPEEEESNENEPEREESNENEPEKEENLEEEESNENKPEKEENLEEKESNENKPEKEENLEEKESNENKPEKEEEEKEEGEKEQKSEAQYYSFFNSNNNTSNLKIIKRIVPQNKYKDKKINMIIKKNLKSEIEQGNITYDKSFQTQLMNYIKRKSGYMPHIKLRSMKTAIAINKLQN